MRPFFLYPKPSERERKPTTTTQADPKTKSRSQAGKQDKSRTKGEKERTRGEKKKTKGETRHKPLNRLTLHAHKAPHNQRKTPRPSKPTRNRRNHAKNPLKTRNKEYLAGIAGEQSRREDKRREHATKAEDKPESLHHLHPVGTMKGSQPTSSPPVFLPTFQKYV